MPMPTLSLDFDGVLHAYTSGWKGASVVPDGPVPGAMRFLVEAVHRFDVVVFSSRSHQPGGTQAMGDAILSWLTEEVGFDVAMDTFRRLSFPDVKPSAHLSIDDRGFCFEGIFPSLDDIASFKPWNRR